MVVCVNGGITRLAKEATLSVIDRNVVDVAAK